MNKNQLDLVQRIIQQKAIFARRCEVQRRRIKLIIEAICSGLCRDENDLENLLSLLFFERKLTIKDELNFLITRKLICQQKNHGLCGTQLGQAVFTSSLSPDIALQVYDDLEKATRSLALDNELHLLYLVTPLHSDSIWMNYIDWNVYYNIWSKLPTKLQRVGKMIGILDSFILGKIQGRQASKISNMQVHLRFLSALALYDLIREYSLGDVARRFRINRGALQTLQQQSATYAYMVVSFCEKLGWTYLRSVLDGFSERLTFGVRKDLTELVQIEGIDGIRARAFHNANITTIPTLAITSIDDIAKILRSVVPYIRAIGIFSDDKIDSLFSTVTSICETNHDKLNAISNNCDESSMNPNSVLSSDVEFISSDFFTHEILPTTSTSKNSEEQIAVSTQSLIQTSKVIEKRPPKMELLKSSNSDEVEKAIFHNCSITNKENLVIPDRLDVENVKQLCADFAHTSMSDETLLRFGCSQYSGEIQQVTQALDAIAVLANNEKFDEIKSEKQQDELTDLKIFESLNIFNSTKNETQMIATTTTATSGMKNDNLEKDEVKYFHDFNMKKSSTIQFNDERAMSQQITLQSNEEEKEIIVNSDESIRNQLIFDHSSDLFDRTSYSSISSQSFNTPKNSSYCIKPIDQQSTINCQSLQSSPSFQSPLHKILKYGSSPVTITMENEIKFNESVKNDIKQNFDSNQTGTTEFQIIDVCGSSTIWEQFLIRQKYWSQIGLCIAICNKEIIGIALCPLNDECVYIDFRPKYVSEIEIDKRLEVLDNILKSEQEKYIYDLLSFSRSLRYLRDLVDSPILFNRCTCIQTVSYLAHYRTLDDSALSFQDLLSQLTSPERAVILRNATPRLRAAINAFICLHMHNDLMSAAVRLSSIKSVELELKSVVLFSEIEITGIAFDRNKALTLNSKLQQKLTEIEAKAYGISGIPFNFGSAAEISQILFVRLQIPPPNASTGRHYSTNKIVLQQLAPKYPIISLILEWRRINTALTTSLPILLKLCCSDGRIRANFITHCCTGRVLTVHPNVQNVQKDAIIDGFSIRSLFIVPKGRILLSSDYRQLEMRMLAHLSADPNLISLFLTKDDFFEIITNKWNKNETLHIKVDRNKVKQLCYGIIYGMGAISLSKELGISKQHAQQMIISFFQLFPKVRTWMDKILAMCRTNGFVSTLLGRRRFLPQITSAVLQTELAQAERQAINTCIQGSVAELFKMALLNLRKNLLGTNSSIVMQLHDEVLIETDESSIASIVEIIKHSMTSVTPNLRVPLAVKISFGKSWGELQECTKI
uniref:DNA-directed DNA polymerase n=1 Tax=Brugia malayi TaxID=6279 RepID=A0A0I9N7E7_BRUMA|nr:Bm6150 [Brugia malayi]